MNKGDYVLATKYEDGDPGDQYAVGFFDHTYDHFGQTRYMVTDNDGKQFRGNGFRRCEPITHDEGVWMIAHFPDFKFLEIVEDDEGHHELVGDGVWDWLAKCRAEIKS